MWYKDAVIYEVHVRAFMDSDADGIGDFKGLTQKLDYLQDLGVTAIWLLPFYPSPLRDDGYDIADYYAINPMYGTLRDFKKFLHEAHRRNLQVITELVVNHTSDQHPWFQRSRRAPKDSPWRNFYVWSDRPESYKEARIIFRDFEPSNWTWDPVANAYFWHRFYSHQPDLNYDNPAVHAEIIRVLDFWLDMGVDGLRLDAVPYLYERDGTSCENLPETHAFLKKLRAHVDEKYGDRMLLAEANQWPEDAVTYFGGGIGDECHMAFHFPLMPRLFMAVRMEDRVPILDILEQTPPVPETGQWAVFLRNHDELTLEMVTDEERDYMYRVYANDTKARINLGIRRRLAPLLGSDRKRIELMHLLLFSLPGTPVLYYGDEIGMGDNIFLGDRNGVRTPMQWSSDKNAGFSRATPQALYLPIILDPEYHYEAVNVEAQQQNPHSLLWWMRRVLTLRKRHKALGRGSLEFLQPDNRKVLAFIRRTEEETVLVVANLSRFTQPVHLDLSRFAHHIPVELFGRIKFPPVGEGSRYFLTLSPHAANWFELQPLNAPQAAPTQSSTPVLHAEETWEEILGTKARGAVDSCLAAYCRRTFWEDAPREIKAVRVVDTIALAATLKKLFLLLVILEPVEGDPEEYLLPVNFLTDEERHRAEQASPTSVICRVRVRVDQTEGILFDASAQPELHRALLDALVKRRVLAGEQGEIKPTAVSWLRAETMEGGLDKRALGPFRNGQNTITSVFGERYLLKFFRRLQPGVTPDLETTRFLNATGFPHVPEIGGALEYCRGKNPGFTVGILRRYVSHAQNSYFHTLDMLGRYLERVRTAPPETRPRTDTHESLLQLAEAPQAESVVKLIGTYFELARLLGQRTAELHAALASDTETPEFAPEKFTPFYQRGLFQSLRNTAVPTLQLLRSRATDLPPGVRGDAEKVLLHEPELMERFRAVHKVRINARRIRCHGNLHLGHVLYTGKDFRFVNFEGDFSRPVSEQRIKRSPMRDVASMIQSFRFASHAALRKQAELGTIQEQHLEEFEPWSDFWQRWVAAAYLKAYLEAIKPADLLPELREHTGILLTAYLLDKSLQDLGTDLLGPGQWVSVHLRAILQALQTPEFKLK